MKKPLEVMTKQEIIDYYWVEFLEFVKKENDQEHFFDKDATEINFWHWIIENKI